MEISRRYKIIYLDPPWTYKDKALAGKRGAGCKYSLMSEKDLSILPISEIAADDCMMFIWVTAPKLPVVFPLIETWGFTYKTVAFTWVKKNKKSDGFFWGMGNWTRANAEFCLLAIKGKPKRICAGVHSIVATPIERHSKKPDEVRRRIVKLCGNVSRIEMFAREKANGWDVWGNEVESDIKL